MAPSKQQQTFKSIAKKYKKVLTNTIGYVASPTNSLKHGGGGCISKSKKNTTGYVTSPTNSTVRLSHCKAGKKTPYPLKEG